MSIRRDVLSWGARWPIVALAVSETASLTPTIVQLMEHHVSLRFDRGLIQRLHRQRPAVDSQESPDLVKLFGLFELSVPRSARRDFDHRVERGLATGEPEDLHRLVGDGGSA